jgi:hypothetical protein
MKSSRQPFTLRRVLLREPEQIERAIAVLRNAPLDPLRPLECLVREEVKARKPDQNALMFAGPIRDIASQAWLDGRQYSDDVWHFYLKKAFLPDEFDPELCLEGYVKWASDPDGNPLMVGSTKKLTVRGFSQHLEQVFAFGAALGVEFGEPPQRHQQ